MGRRIDYLPGQLIGKCVFIRYAKNKGKKRQGVFVCPLCGKSFTGTISPINMGLRISCGCLQKYIARKGLSTHGMSNKKIHNRWRGIKTRCYNPNAASYKNYGGRGIKMCDEWRNDFAAFYNYVMSLPNAMKDGYSVDRRNNDGDYEPGNVRWETRTIQTTNSRKRGDNKSGYVGVYMSGNQYVSCLTRKGVELHHERHATKKNAVEARNNYIRENNLTEYKIQEYHD